MLRAWSAIAVCVLLIGTEASAGLHLGMKMACKRYGDAWRSGSLRALQATTTSDFASAWGRVPSSVFQAMPRLGGGDAIDTQKGNRSGVVTASTADGIVDFVVVGSGFDWVVADIRKRNDDGTQISVKDSLNAACTMREFTAIFTNPADNSSLAPMATSRLQAAIAAVPENTMKRIRSSLRRGQPQTTPKIEFRSFGAIVTVFTSKTSADERVVFHLVDNNGWKVDDMGFVTERLQMASFRNNVAALAAASDFGAFCRGDRSTHPTRFTAEGDLQKELVWLHENDKPFPSEKNGPHKCLKIAADNRWVQAIWEEHRITMDLSTTAGGIGVSRVQLVADDKQQDVAELLANYRRVMTIAGGQPAVKLLGLVLDAGND